LIEAEKVDFYPGSPLANPEHPLRKIEKASSEKRVERDKKEGAPVEAPQANAEAPKVNAQ